MTGVEERDYYNPVTRGRRDTAGERRTVRVVMQLAL
jgi:hypothetical protein